MRRVRGRHDYRMDGLTDLLIRAQGMSVLDLGCNRGMVGKDFSDHGARKVHGCDLDKDVIFVARSVFIDIRNVDSKFEVVDLTKPSALSVFDPEYDTVLMLATYHKLKRVMQPADLSELIRVVASKAKRYFAWRGTSEKREDNEQEMRQLDRDLGGMKRIHTSYISQELGVAAIWSKP
jgi:SAM-dependent methyltransferase